MNLFGHTFGHKTHFNSEPFHGISPTADKEAEDASEAAFDKFEQSERLGRVTIHGAVHADSLEDGDVDAVTTQTESPQAQTNRQTSA